MEKERKKRKFWGISLVLSLPNRTLSLSHAWSPIFLTLSHLKLKKIVVELLDNLKKFLSNLLLCSWETFCVFSCGVKEEVSKQLNPKFVIKKEVIFGAVYPSYFGENSTVQSCQSWYVHIIWTAWSLKIKRSFYWN